MSTMTATSSYITFRLGEELFAIEVEHVCEVLEMAPIARVPTAPNYMRGLINVRGKAIPVVDLRLKFGLPSTPDTLETRIILIELDLDGQPSVVGGIADSVNEVIELEASQIHPPPRIGMRWRSELINGMGQRADNFIILLNIDAVFSLDDLAAVKQIEDTESSESSSQAT
jgi:purine-binding chemotaxis protein CheW